MGGQASLDQLGALQSGASEEEHLAQVVLQSEDVVEAPHIRHPSYAHLRQTPECPLSDDGVGGVESEEDAAAHDSTVHQSDDLDTGREEVEEVLGPVDVDQVEAVSLSDLLVFLTSDTTLCQHSVSLSSLVTS